MTSIAGGTGEAASAQFEDWDDDFDWSFGDFEDDSSSAEVSISEVSTSDASSVEDSLDGSGGFDDARLSTPSYDMFGNSYDSHADAQVADLVHDVVATKANIDLGLPSDGLATHTLNDVPSGMYQSSSGTAVVGTDGNDFISARDGKITIDPVDRTPDQKKFVYEPDEDEDLSHVIIVGNGGVNNFEGSDDSDIYVGGPNADRILSEAGSDFIWAGPGADVIESRSGADYVHGGDDNDEIYPGIGGDTVHGGKGNDLIDETNRVYDFGVIGWNDSLHGGPGNDTVLAGWGDDFVTGGNGNDLLFGGKGDDRLVGDGGADLIQGNEGADVLFGSDGDDLLYGGKGYDELNGNDGDDYADGGPQKDKVRGQAGQDILSGGLGEDELDGGAGNDTVIASAGGDVVLDTSDVDSDTIYASKWLDRIASSDSDVVIVVEYDKRLAGSEIENGVEDSNLADRVASDLVTLGSIPSGKGLLARLDGSRKTVEILDGAGGEPSFVSYGEGRDPQILGIYGTQGQEGAGLDSQIYLAPITSLDSNSTLPIVELAHELSHAGNIAGGVVPPGRVPAFDSNGTPILLPNGDNALIQREELAALDVENEIRSELNLRSSEEPTADSLADPTGGLRNRFYFRPPNAAGIQSEGVGEFDEQGLLSVGPQRSSSGTDEEVSVGSTLTSTSRSGSTDSSYDSANSAESANGDEPASLANSAGVAGLCEDSDGDGWGWDGQQSCKQTPTADKVRSVRYPNCQHGFASDPDGDGFGWENQQTCIA